MSGDEELERLMKLIDIGIVALRSGDGDGAEMALKAALTTANRLPNKPPAVIHLPDQSKS